MYIPFEKLSDQAPIWIYQAEHQLSEEENKAILQKAYAFLATWTAHGQPLQGSAIIRYNRFLVLAIEKPAYELSCCITDKGIHFLHELQTTLQVNFLNRTQIILAHGDEHLAIPLSQVKSKIQQQADMLFFDNTINHKAALTHKWLVPVKDSWLDR